MLYDGSKITSRSVHKIHKLHSCTRVFQALEGISHYSILQITFHFSNHYITVSQYSIYKKSISHNNTPNQYNSFSEWKSLLLLNIGPGFTP
ncbi:hypothetical protein PAMP_019418 [Pampus punctatissimus]